mgnify:CR=1 FL=1
MQLLRVAIGTSELEVLFEGVDWYELLGLSERHGVNAVVLDGFGKFRLDSIGLKNISQSFIKRKIQCIALALKIESEYDWKLGLVEKLIRLWNSNGIRTIALKGFVTCQYYPNPKHRPFCDFDYFLCGVFERGNEVIRQEGIEVKGNYKYKTFDIGCLHVENHRYCTHFRGHDKDRSFEKLLEVYMLLEQPIYILKELK